MARRTDITAADTALNIRREAVSLFAQYGYAAVSMRQIATAVGVMPGALYHHFATKQELLMSLLCEHMDRLHIAWDSHKTSCKFDRLDATAQLLSFISFHIRYHIALPEDVFISMMELRSLEAENFTKIELSRKAYENIVKDILASNTQDNQMKVDDVHVTAMAILNMLTGVTSWFDHKGRLSEDDIISYYCALGARMVGIEPDITQNQHLDAINPPFSIRS